MRIDLRARQISFVVALVLFAASGSIAGAQMMLTPVGATDATLTPGATASFLVQAQNLNTLPDTISVGASGGVVTSDPSGSTMLAGETIWFGFDVSVPPSTPPGTTLSPFVFVSTSLGSFASVGYTISVGLPVAAPSFAQPAGPSTPLAITVIDAFAGYEYFNLFSVELPPGGYATGPYLGLYVSSLSTLLDQLAVPPGTAPFRFSGTAADGSAPVDLGAYGLPVGLTFDCLTLTPRLFPAVGDPPFLWSPVVRVTTF
jgi:hypothetical protein